MTNTIQERTLEEVLATITMPSAKGVFSTIVAGVNRKDTLNRVFNRETIRKTCQYLVNNLFITFDEGTKSYVVLHYFRQNMAESVVGISVNSPVPTLPYFTSTYRSDENQTFDSDLDKKDSDKSEFHYATDPVSLTKILDEILEHLPPDLREVFDSSLTIDARPFQKKRIDSVKKILGLVMQLSDSQMEILQHHRKKVKSFFQESELGDDLVDRIAMMQMTLGINPFAEDCKLLRKWQQECNDLKAAKDAAGEKNKKGKACKKFSFLAAIVQKIYKFYGVEWTANRNDYDMLFDLAENIRSEIKRIKKQVQSPMLFTERELNEAADDRPQVRDITKELQDVEVYNAKQKGLVDMDVLHS